MVNNIIYNKICDLNRAYESDAKAVSKAKMYEALTEVESLMKEEVDAAGSVRLKRTEAAAKMLDEAGYSGNTVGFKYLAEGIAIAADNYSFKLKDDIYPVITQIHKVSEKAVEFGMAFALKQYAAKKGLPKPPTAKAIISQYSKELRKEEEKNATKFIPG